MVDLVDREALGLFLPEQNVISHFSNVFLFVVSFCDLPTNNWFWLLTFFAFRVS